MPDTAATSRLDREIPAPRTSLSTDAARLLATTTKTVPQMQGISSRWLLRSLEWVDVKGGTYRVNRRRTITPGRGRIQFVQNGADDVRIIPESLTAFRALSGFDDVEILTELAALFSVRHLERGEVVHQQGAPVAEAFVVAHGRVRRYATGKYGKQELLAVLSDGDQLGEEAVGVDPPVWPATVVAETDTVLLTIPWGSFLAFVGTHPTLGAHLEAFVAGRGQKTDKGGEVAIDISSGHDGEPALPGTYPDYDLSPREYDLSVTQTVLNIHTRVADLFNSPHDQTSEQIRLTVEAVRERQEWEMLNNRDFGLLHNADYDQRINTAGGPPTPDDLDTLLSMRRNTKFFLAHPKAIAAFFAQCNSRGLMPHSIDRNGHAVPAWRGVPLLPCGKIPVSAHGTTSILAVRTGEKDQGVVGLHQTGIPDEVDPSLNVRFMGINQQAVISYLVTAYYSAAILVPDALGVLENVQLGRVS